MEIRNNRLSVNGSSSGESYIFSAGELRECLQQRRRLGEIALEASGFYGEEGKLIARLNDLSGAALRMSLLSRKQHPNDETLWFDRAIDGQLIADKILTIADHEALSAELPDIHEQVFRARMRDRSIGERLLSLTSYAAFWEMSPRSQFTVSDWGPSDCVFVQAFGRNSYTDKQLPEVASIRKESDGDNQALDSLIHSNFLVGASNHALAENTKRIIETSRVEAMVQWEVAAALKQVYPDWYDRYSSAIHVLWPSSIFFPTTKVKRDSIKYMKERGLYAPIELAHEAMLVRAQAILRRQGVAAEAPSCDPGIPFDPGSTQPWTRGRVSWATREFLTRAHHVVFGQVHY